MPYTIVQIKETDVEALCDLSKETFKHSFAHLNTAANMSYYLNKAFSKTQIEMELAEPNSAYYWIESDGNHAGYLKLNYHQAQTESFDPHAIEIQRIYLHHAYQKVGLGRAMIEYAIEQGKVNNCTQIWLGVWKKNQESIAFYEKMGFTIFDSHEFPFGDEIQTDLLMKRKLD